MRAVCVSTVLYVLYNVCTGLVNNWSAGMVGFTVSNKQSRPAVQCLGEACLALPCS